MQAFLIGLGIYLGFVWTKGLNQSSTLSGNKAIFITYIASVFVCYSLYALSNITASVQTDEEDLLRKMVERAQSAFTTNSAPSSSMNTSDRQRRFQNYSSDIQHLLRESARSKRDLATLDDSIAQLLEGRAS